MEIILVGGGKYAGLLYEMFSGQHRFIGYIDDVYQSAYIEEHYTLPFLGSSQNLNQLLNISTHAFISIGSEGSTTARQEYFQRFVKAGFSFPTLINPSATIASNVIIGYGTTLHHRVLVLPMAKIGNNCVISSNVLISHDTFICDNVYIAPGAIINGSCVIEDGAFIGTGAIVIQKRKVGKNCIIGAGACVIKDIPDGCTAVGVPARILAEKNKSNNHKKSSQTGNQI